MSNEVFAVTGLALARVCYEADRALRTSLGKPGIREWIALGENERIARREETVAGLLRIDDARLVGLNDDDEKLSPTDRARLALMRSISRTFEVTDG